MKITINLDNQRQAIALAQFCKRATFEDADRRAHGETPENKKAMAYDILTGLARVQTGIEEYGLYVR